mmetsp:Transcript_9260/g.12871  ORF Transcript_9260/g.12871 Transcript_9260/m.12871 type:complete len:92 (+) Transcript_9260:758-1033(+)
MLLWSLSIVASMSGLLRVIRRELAASTLTRKNAKVTKRKRENLFIFLSRDGRSSNVDVGYFVLWQLPWHGAPPWFQAFFFSFFLLAGMIRY